MKEPFFHELLDPRNDSCVDYDEALELYAALAEYIRDNEEEK